MENLIKQHSTIPVIHFLSLYSIHFQGTETKSIYMGEDGVFDFDKPLVPDQEDEERLKDNLGGLFSHLND